MTTTKRALEDSQYRLSNIDGWEINKSLNPQYGSDIAMADTIAKIMSSTYNKLGTDVISESAPNFIIPVFNNIKR